MEKGLKICRLLAESERQIQEQAANVCGKKYVIKKWSPCHITSSLSGMTSTEIIEHYLRLGIIEEYKPTPIQFIKRLFGKLQFFYI